MVAKLVGRWVAKLVGRWVAKLEGYGLLTDGAGWLSW
jgi:hypothetical protein